MVAVPPVAHAFSHKKTKKAKSFALYYGIKTLFLQSIIFAARYEILGQKNPPIDGENENVFLPQDVINEFS